VSQRRWMANYNLSSAERREERTANINNRKKKGRIRPELHLFLVLYQKGKKQGKIEKKRRTVEGSLRKGEEPINRFLDLALTARKGGRNII